MIGIDGYKMVTFFDGSFRVNTAATIPLGDRFKALGNLAIVPGRRKAVAYLQ